MSHGYFSDDEYDELREKRREAIDLKAKLDRAKREINSLQYLLKEEQNMTQAQLNHVISLSEAEERHELANEAWQEKVAYLEEELENKSIVHWYLRPAFWFMTGVVVGIIVLSLII